jgi:hypothetical protein
MARCKDLWCLKHHAVCVSAPPLGAHPPARFRLVGGPRPYLSVEDDRELSPEARYNLGDRRKLRALGLALVELTKPRPRRRMTRR